MATRKYGKKEFKKKTIPNKFQYMDRFDGYDGILKLKIHNTYDIFHNTLVAHADFTVNWAGNGIAPGSGNTARVTVCNEMTTFSPLYTEYRVIGCKVNIIPICQATGATGSGVYNMWIGSDSLAMPGSATGDNQMMSLCDFKEVSLGEPSQQFFNVQKYYKNRDIGWISVSQSYPDMSTLFRLYSVGYANGYVMAKAHVTWYVQYKGPQL